MAIVLFIFSYSGKRYRTTSQLCFSSVQVPLCTNDVYAGVEKGAENSIPAPVPTWVPSWRPRPWPEHEFAKHQTGKPIGCGEQNTTRSQPKMYIRSVGGMLILIEVNAMVDADQPDGDAGTLIIPDDLLEPNYPFAFPVWQGRQGRWNVGYKLRDLKCPQKIDPQ